MKTEEIHKNVSGRSMILLLSFLLKMRFILWLFVGTFVLFLEVGEKTV